MLISILLMFSLGTVFAEVSKDNVNATSAKNMTNITKNNTTFVNTTDVTNPFAKVRGYLPPDHPEDIPINLTPLENKPKLPLVSIN